MPNAAPENKARLPRTDLFARWAGLAAAAAFALCAGLAPAPASAEIKLGGGAKKPAYKYAIYVGGVKIGDATFSANIGDGDYFTEGLLVTDGVSKWFVAATVAAKARGRIDKAVRPQGLEVSGKTEKLTWKMSIAYSGDAPNNVSSQPPFRKKSYEIDPRKQNGALDPMSAMIATLAPTTSGTPCNRVIPIFDGRKRYDIVFGRQTAKGKGPNGFMTYECDSKWKRVGGFKPKMMRKDDIEFTARFERRGGLTVPVRVWGETEFGDAIAILKSAR